MFYVKMGGGSAYLAIAAAVADPKKKKDAHERRGCYIYSDSIVSVFRVSG